MLSSIHPLGERAKGNRWGTTATAFVLGSTAGGVTVGGLAGGAGSLFASAVPLGTSVVLGLLLVVMVAAATFDLSQLGLRLPSVRRQVDENWLTQYRGWVYGVGYGFQLGLGVITVVNSAAVYAAIAAAFLTGSVRGGAFIGAAFGLVRGIAILPGRRITSTDQLRGFHRSLDRWSSVAARLAPLGETVVVLLVAGSIVVR